MAHNSNSSIADSLETVDALLPLMPELLQDLWALGCSLPIILDMLAHHSISSDMRVLDLGCGKGAVSVSLARQFGCNVDGLDAFEPFLILAREKAIEYQVQDLCQFSNVDIRVYCQEKHDYDVVILASLGGILGSWKHTVKCLRKQLKDGGYIIIDDGYLKHKTRTSRKGYAHYRSYEQTLQALTVFGDQIIDERDTTEFSRQINREYLNSMQKRSELLLKKRPELERAVRDYIENQNKECDFLDEYLVGTVWLLQKK